MNISLSHLPGPAVRFFTLCLLLGGLSACHWRSPFTAPGHQLHQQKSNPGADSIVWEGRRFQLYRHARVQRYLNRVGTRVIRANSSRHRCCRFVVYRHYRPNAFSRSDGTVFLSTGLLRKIENEAQLAAIIGHELAHVFLDHSHVSNTRHHYGFDSARRLRRQQHAFEFEADRVGLEYAARAGYDPRQLIRIFRLVHRRSLRRYQGPVSSRYPDTHVRLQRIRQEVSRLRRRYSARGIYQYRYQSNIRRYLH